jgi:dienelactone hydrolase
MGKYFGPGGPAQANKMIGQLEAVVKDLKEKEKLEKLGIVGYCWGAKVSDSQRLRAPA